jgi:hypothetical protein
MLTLMRSHERCWLLLTAGRWPWKSEFAKECVTTHRPKQLALKMDDAVALNSYSTVKMIIKKYDIFTSKRVAVVSVEGDRRESAWSCH